MPAMSGTITALDLRLCFRDIAIAIGHDIYCRSRRRCRVGRIRVRSLGQDGRIVCVIVEAKSGTLECDAHQWRSCASIGAHVRGTLARDTLFGDSSSSRIQAQLRTRSSIGCGAESQTTAAMYGCFRRPTASERCSGYSETSARLSRLSMAARLPIEFNWSGKIRIRRPTARRRVGNSEVRLGRRSLRRIQ